MVDEPGRKGVGRGAAGKPASHPLKVVFFGSSDGVFSNRHFTALMRTGCTLAAVVDVPPDRRSSTNSARPGSESFVQVARSRDVPVFEPENPNENAFVDGMRALAPDLFIAVGYMLLLKPPLLSVPRTIAANFHASLLPAYRGKHPVFWALRNGELWCGLTVHEMSPGLDTGDIIFQVKVPTREADSVSDLYNRIMEKSMPLVGRLVSSAGGGKEGIPRKPQGTVGASYFGATKSSDFRLDWSMEASVLARWVTATPGKCFAGAGANKGTRILFIDGKAEAMADSAAAGTLVRMRADSCAIAATGGALRVSRVRGQDGRVMSAYEAFRELGLREGMSMSGGNP